MENYILSATTGYRDVFANCFLHSPIVTSHTFPLKVRNPENLISVTLWGLHKVGGLIGPPPCHLEVGLHSVSDRVNKDRNHPRIQNQSEI